ncbi:hypothetical protein KUH03_32005 [Sphingobacterium sp. E70]|uniref:hypothetical protein n=1 Tax=Sphingobacterium sp. E70 TaxID=2853439 RepID=UPI00211B7C04|nr:hypothetical protein [Sphingobacterium sp. E70]ULT23733.1 hypothetical protein KUH03_32005 [Sphingobacterium sp. E70]
MQSYDKEGAHYFNYLKCNRMNGFVLSSDDIERCSHLMELMQTEYRTAKLVSKELLRNQLLSLLQLLGHRITKILALCRWTKRKNG